MFARKVYAGLMLAMLLTPSWGNHAAAQSASRYFPVTSYSVSGSFLTFWQNNGGLPQLGLPISHPYRERNDADGNIYCVQYFERARLEYHPEQQNPKYRIMLGLVGVEDVHIRYPHGISAPTNGDFSIPENDNDILLYSVTHQILGLPLTGTFDETESDGNQYRVLYTEHDRLERHGGIMLGLVGKEVYAHKAGQANAASCTPGS